MEITIHKNSFRLLEKLFDIELEQFLVNKQGSFGTLSKQSKVMQCLEDIKSHIIMRSNSVFTVQNADRSLSVNIHNVEKDNDHIKLYLISLSESAKTFSIDEVISMERSELRNIKNFDPSEI